MSHCVVAVITLLWMQVNDIGRPVQTAKTPLTAEGLDSKIFGKAATVTELIVR